VNIEELGRLLRAHFPDLRIDPVRLVDVGFGSTVVETGDRIIFRFARSKRAAAGHERELRLLRQLVGRLPVDVPDPQWRIERDAHVPFGAVGYGKLGGEPLRSDDADDVVARDVAEFLRALHGLEGVEAAKGADERVALRDATLPVLRKRLERGEVDQLETWWRGVLADDDFRRFEPVLRHGDLWNENLLVDQGRLVGVLDWGAAAIGDPAEDFAPLRHVGAAFADAVLDAYGADDALRHRAWRHWELRELYGIRAALELGDEEELADGIAKLRAGPILRPE
jgi:aminoglycoside phosphotransferase (APT) family kinase protein